LTTRQTVQIKARFEEIQGRFEIDCIDEVIAAFEEYEDDLLSGAAKVHIHCYLNPALN